MITSVLWHKVFKQRSKLETKQLQTIYDNLIFVSQSLLTVIEIENLAITDHLWQRHSCVRKNPNRYRNWKPGNYRPFMIVSFLCQKATKHTSKLKTKQLKTIYDKVIVVSESLQTDIEIENEEITDHLWWCHSCVRKPPNSHQNWKPCN